MIKYVLISAIAALTYACSTDDSEQIQPNAATVDTRSQAGDESIAAENTTGEDAEYGLMTVPKNSNLTLEPETYQVTITAPKGYQVGLASATSCAALRTTYTTLTTTILCIFKNCQKLICDSAKNLDAKGY